MTFMAREMAEQPAVIGALLGRRDELAARLRELAPQPLTGVLLIARGSSDNAAVYGRYVLEAALRRPVSMAAPSLWTRYGIEEDLHGYLAVGVSQSGRTPEIADTLERVGAAGAATVAITNDADSPLAAAAGLTIELQVGPEHAVPATKTVTAQLAAFAILAHALGDPLWSDEAWEEVPRAQAAVLADDAATASAGAVIARSGNHVQLGRGFLYGATFFEPVHEAALVLGLDLGARFLRGAICDLRGEVRARQDIEMPGADVHAVTAAVAELRDRLLAAAGLPAGVLDGAVAGVPGVVEAPSARIGLANNIPGLEGFAVGPELEARLGVPVTVENDVNLAAIGERSRGVAQGVEDFVFLSVGTGLGAGIVLHGELHRGHHGAAGEVDFALGAGHEDARDDDPAAVGVSAYAAALAAEGRLATALAPPFDARAIFGAARAGDALALAVVEEEARRIARHVLPIAAVADVELIVLGGGIGANGDLLLAPVREQLTRRLPYPPRLEVSSLGDAAVLTGALAFGLRSALDNVFTRRSRAART